jgi:hypothetical protein
MNDEFGLPKKRRANPFVVDENVDARVNLLNLALRFPTLRRIIENDYEHFVSSTRGLDLEKLAEWTQLSSSGERHAAAFICNLYNDRAAWKCAKFDFFGAWATWDDEHREVFMTWAKNGWMP